MKDRDDRQMTKDRVGGMMRGGGSPGSHLVSPDMTLNRAVKGVLLY